MAKPWKREPITAIYARGSKDTQHNAIPVQVEKLKRHIESQEAKGEPLPPLAEVFEDFGQSGVKKRFIERPEGQRLLRALQTDDVLLVTRMDRLGRNVVDILSTIELLQKRGVRIIILDFFKFELDTTSPVARLMLHLTAAVAEFEGAMISTRTKETLDNLRRQGKKTGCIPPRGFKFVGDKVVEDDEMKVWYGRMTQLRKGGATFQAIADWLNKVQAPAPKGSTKDAVDRYLKTHPNAKRENVPKTIRGSWTKRNVARTLLWLKQNEEAALAAEEEGAA